MEDQPAWYWIILKKELEEESTDGIKKAVIKGRETEDIFRVMVDVILLCQKYLE